MWILVLVLSLLLTGCMSTTTNGYYTEAVESWRWGKGTTLLDVWGRPDRLARLPNGDLLYIYEKETYQRYPITASTNIPTYTTGVYGMATLVPSSTPFPLPTNFLLRCVTSFEVDPSDIIVSMRAQGNNCTANKGFMLTKSNPHPRRRSLEQEQDAD